MNPRFVSHDLVVEASPIASDSCTYRLKVRNTSDTALLNVRLNLYEALEPDDFGLDDTHMKRNLAGETLVEIACMAPATEVSFIRERHGPMSRFSALPTKKLPASFLRCDEPPESADKLIYFSVRA